MSEETRDVLEKAELMMQKGWLAGYERVTPELVEEIRRLREALLELCDEAVGVGSRCDPMVRESYPMFASDFDELRDVATRARALLPGDSDDQ